MAKQRESRLSRLNNDVCFLFGNMIYQFNVYNVIYNIQKAVVHISAGKKLIAR